LEKVLVKENHMFLVWEKEAGVEEDRNDLFSLSQKAEKRQCEVSVSRLRQAYVHSEVATLQASS